MKSKATYGIWLDTRHKLKSEKYPAKIRITYQRQTKYFPILESKYAPLEFTTEEWDLLSTGNPRGRMRDIQLEIRSREDKVKEMVNTITNFTFDKFNDLLLGKKINVTETSLKACITARIDKYKLEKRVSTAANAKSILNSFNSFLGGKDIDITEVTAKLLKEYELWMLKNGRSSATIGIYTREIRVMFNELIADGLVNGDCYPFGKGKFQPPRGKKVKSEIYKSEVLKILNYKANEQNKEAFSRDMWIFSYLCNGMNVKDIALLKYKNIDKNFIHFVRAKTARNNNLEKIIPVPMTAPVLKIIKKWGNQNLKNNYIFSILDGSESPEDIRRKVLNMNHLISDTIKRIGKKLKIKNTNISAVSARDAFATISLMQGRPLKDISESLGHSTIEVTIDYIGRITDKDKITWQKKLI